MAAFHNPAITGVLTEVSCTNRPADSSYAHVARPKSWFAANVTVAKHLLTSRYAAASHVAALRHGISHAQGRFASTLTQSSICRSSTHNGTAP